MLQLWVLYLALANTVSEFEILLDFLLKFFLIIIGVDLLVKYFLADEFIFLFDLL